VNDGACALIVASEAAAKKHRPHAARAHPRHGVGRRGAAHHGDGPAPASKKLAARLGIPVAKIDVIELNEAFASGARGVARPWLSRRRGTRESNGGAIALGHPLGASGARLITTAMYQLRRANGKLALCTMCIGVGQGIALAIERV
jgi:acetyl-CoA acetyltransferase